MSEQIPWYHVGATSSSNPFASVGIDYCMRQRKQVDTDFWAVHQGTTFTFKKTCVECGYVICSGIFDRVAVMSHKPLPPAALEWTITPGKDRTGRR